MKKLVFLLSAVLLISGSSLAGMSKKDCERYVAQIEKCIKEEKKGDLNKKWKYCEGLALWNLLTEYKNNGFCFDDEECKEMILKDIQSCENERNALYRKLLQEQK
ncbi:hypothetical protein [Persephonella sp.]